MQDRIIEPREVPLGGIRALNVWRTLPHRELPTVGAWCFVDHFGPTDDVMTVLPHPHTGLQTVTWPLSGEVRHRDNLGSDVVLRPGELNLMTAGDGVSHSEFSVGEPGLMHGIQLWVALPDGPRTGPAAFEHISDLPRVAGEGWRGIVLVGEFDGATSKATTYTPLVGVELTIAARSLVTIPLDPNFEHADPRRRRAVLGAGLHRGPAPAGALPRAGTRPRRRRRRPRHHVAPARRRAVHRTARHVVELHRPRPRRDRRRPRGLGGPSAARFGSIDGHDGQLIPAPPMPSLRLKPRVRH